MESGDETSADARRPPFVVVVVFKAEFETSFKETFLGSHYGIRKASEHRN